MGLENGNGGGWIIRESGIGTRLPSLYCAIRTQTRRRNYFAAFEPKAEIGRAEFVDLEI
jgi:hypothetical protein